MNSAFESEEKSEGGTSPGSFDVCTHSEIFPFGIAKTHGDFAGHFMIIQNVLPHTH